MKPIIPGQRIKLIELTTDRDFQVSIKLSFKQPLTVDISCFGLDNQGQLSDDRYMIFYNQKASPCGAVAIVNDSPSNSLTLKVDLAALPAKIERLVFTAAIDGSGTMSALDRGELQIIDKKGGGAALEFGGNSLNQEKALIIAELYLKGEWRLGAIVQGFNQGLSALLKHFGGEEAPAAASPAPASPPASASAQLPSPDSTVTPSPSPPPPPPKIKLTKITLEKKGDKKSITLEKSQNNIIHINLNWNAPEVKKLSFFGSNSSPDLDLGCMFRLKNGEKGVIQPLGNYFGSKQTAPYILLDQDDRTGSSNTGENLFVYRPELIDFIMIFAMIYQGAKNFTEVNGRVMVKDHKGNEIYIKLDAPDPRYGFCAVCSFKNIGRSLDLTKHELYFASHKEADKHFGFGFEWVKGSK